jgi:phage terminase Nu1 subunit (DNA packaging protein)
MSERDDFERLLHAPVGVESVARELERVAAGLPSRVDADPERVERGLAQLVLTLIDFLRRLMETQALRRMEEGSLTEEEIERMGTTFMRLDARMEELKEQFGLEDEDLNLNLGPLGDLM